MPEAASKPDGVRAWALEENCDRERELVEALHQAATGKDADVDTAAAKFLLANLWPKRWSVSPHPAKASPLDDVVEAQEPDAGADNAHGLPFRLRVVRRVG